MASIPKEKINNLILNYFIQEGYQEAAISFSKELNIDVYKSLPYDDNQHHHPNHQHQSNINVNDRSIQFIRNMNSLNNNEFTNMVEHYFDDHDRSQPLSKNNSNQYNLPYFKTNLTSGYSTIKQRKEIKLLILKGSITEAIKKISEYFPTILDTNNLLHFKLLRLNLIEMIRDHKLNANLKDNDDESIFLNNILGFVRENLINKVSNSFKLLKELEITMSLLCFNFDPTLKNIEDQKDLPDELRLLFDLSLRNQCYRLVNKSILSLYSNNNNNTTNNNLNDNGSNGDDNENEYNFINQAGGGSSSQDDTNAGHGMFNKSELSNSPIYKGPKFIEYDLNNFMFNDVDDEDEGEGEEDDEEDDDEVDGEDYGGVEDIEYNIEYDKTLSQFMSANDLTQDDDNNNNGNGTNINRENIDEELSKLQSLSLESKLERIIKLWTITEQRLLDLNIIKQKRYSLNDEL
ncbi:CTLH/CRA C-terminal to lish motif domain-containing protein [Scheffersomyces coipomensis]|uniref:CTLH/CRA C-terminal to lish motif domain-containing protein n=1 Tax=Scheffersomyces coipomensis TaxID=1788519 RepID=UPI00315D9CE5